MGPLHMFAPGKTSQECRKRNILSGVKEWFVQVVALDARWKICVVVAAGAI
jgi:hypothetical protein